MKDNNIKINLSNILKVQVAGYKEEKREFLKSVFIEDYKGKRFYVSTNGHILLFIYEKIIGDELKQPILIYPVKEKIDIKYPMEFILEKLNSKFYLLKNDELIISLKINDGTFPNWRKQIPNIKTNKAKEYCAFDPKYIKMLQDFFEKKLITDIPVMADNSSVAMFKKDNFTALLMPLRLSGE